MQNGDAWKPAALNRLRERYGKEIELVGDDGAAETFRLVAEYRIGDADYAALQTPAMRKDDELAFFRVVEEAGKPSLETIEDEEEWETAAEGYDSLLFEGDFE